ncbi:MAG: prolipoprotein diacylglyceryl transferase [Candidatus Gracilibacteria bacterium]|nr:prolipoprotein diacylglyceryl transferase [Candidatus Gracilibacteria bacterium]MDD2909270.1 prolipoprotein diacylglyceryl transferase [Candidatus Gracilibacteria bacterium]
MTDYNFSLIGGIIGFFLVLYFKIKKFKLKSEKYIDAAVLAFLFAAIIGYIGTFLGGQIIGKPTDLGIGVTYTNTFSKSPYSGAVFPLAILYSIFSFILFTGLYITRIFIKIEGFIGYIGMIIFSSLLLIFEFFNGNPDIFSSYVILNITQLGAIGLIIFASLGLSKIYKKESES